VSGGQHDDVVRTTISIDQAVFRQAKARAAESGRSVSEVVEDAVRAALAPQARDAAEPQPLPVIGSSGVLPGVDLSSNTALLGVMDEDVQLDALR
jgi:hypothetical protein